MALEQPSRVSNAIRGEFVLRKASYRIVQRNNLAQEDFSAFSGCELVAPASPCSAQALATTRARLCGHHSLYLAQALQRAVASAAYFLGTQLGTVFPAFLFVPIFS